MKSARISLGPKSPLAGSRRCRSHHPSGHPVTSRWGVLHGATPIVAQGRSAGQSWGPCLLRAWRR